MSATPPSIVALAAAIAGTNPAATSAPCFRSEFSLRVAASPPAATALFGANGERPWAGPEWDPEFLLPLPAEDRPGAVFLISRPGAPKVLCYTPVFDPERGHVRHVMIRGGDIATVIDVRVRADGREASRVVVVYERIALRREAESEARVLASDDAAQAEEWESAIEKHLSSQRKAP